MTHQQSVVIVYNINCNCSHHLFVDFMRVGQKSVPDSFMVLKEHVVWHIWTLTIKVRASKTTQISANFAKVEVNTYPSSKQPTSVTPGAVGKVVLSTVVMYFSTVRILAGLDDFRAPCPPLYTLFHVPVTYQFRLNSSDRCRLIPININWNRPTGISSCRSTRHQQDVRPYQSQTTTYR